MHEFIVNLFIRLISHGEIEKRLFIDDALIVREGLEPRLAVIRAQSALLKSAERHVGSRQMNDHVVDAAAAKAEFFRQPPDTPFIGGKQIKGERSLP